MEEWYRCSVVRVAYAHQPTETIGIAVACCLPLRRTTSGKNLSATSTRPSLLTQSKAPARHEAEVGAVLLCAAHAERTLYRTVGMSRVRADAEHAATHGRSARLHPVHVTQTQPLLCSM